MQRNRNGELETIFPGVSEEFDIYCISVSRWARGEEDGEPQSISSNSYLSLGEKPVRSFIERCATTEFRGQEFKWDRNSYLYLPTSSKERQVLIGYERTPNLVMDGGIKGVLLPIRDK